MAEKSADFDELLARVQTGSQDAIRELVARCNPLIVRSIRRRLPKDLRRAFDSDDFLQIVWATVFHHRSRLNGINNRDEFVGYLVRVTGNKVGMTLRNRNTKKRYKAVRECSLDSKIASRPGDVPTPSEHAIADETRRTIAEGKPPLHMEIIRLRILGNSNRQIADQLDMDEGSVRRIIRSIRKETET